MTQYRSRGRLDESGIPGGTPNNLPKSEREITWHIFLPSLLQTKSHNQLNSLQSMMTMMMLSLRSFTRSLTRPDHICSGCQVSSTTRLRETKPGNHARSCSVDNIRQKWEIKILTGLVLKTVQPYVCILFYPPNVSRRTFDIPPLHQVGVFIFDSADPKPPGANSAATNDTICDMPMVSKSDSAGTSVMRILFSQSRGLALG